MASKSLGPFPKTIRWHQIVRCGGGNFAEAEALLTTSRRQMESLANDVNAQAAIRFLVAVVIATRSKRPLRALASEIGTRAYGYDSATLIQGLNDLIPVDHGAKVAAVRTLRDVCELPAAQLFATDDFHVWRMYDGSAFCDLARLFFSRLNEVVLTSALDESSLSYDVAQLDRFAWEASLITRAFSARWFNACARNTAPENGSIDWYLAHCLGKIDLELARESSNWQEPTGGPWKRRKPPQSGLQLRLL